MMNGSENWRVIKCLKSVAIDIPGGKRSLVKNIIAQTTKSHKEHINEI